MDQGSVANLRIGIDLRFLATPGIRGFVRYTLELVTALAALPDVTVIGFTDKPLNHEVQVDVFCLPAGRETWTEQVLLPRWLRSHQVDVLICPTNRGLPLFGPPSVLVLHDAIEWTELAETTRGSWKSSLRLSLSSIVSLAAATRILTVSNYSSRSIVERIGISPHRVRVVYEAPGRFTADVEGAIKAGALGLPLHSFVLYFGGFDSRKDVATLLKGFASSRSRQDQQLILAGDDAGKYPQLMALVGELGIADRVRFVGRVSDLELSHLVGSASCFVSASLDEGFGLPATECMAQGVPVIVADAGASPEIVGGGGLLFAPGDWRALATLLDQLDDPDEWRRWSQNAKARVRVFDWGSTAIGVRAVCVAAADNPESIVKKVGRLVRGARRFNPQRR